MKPKYQTCKYNIQAEEIRTALNVACVWKITMRDSIVMPPHVYFHVRPIDETTCSKCRCYEKATDDE
jgi:hypothetical protein